MDDPLVKITGEAVLIWLYFLVACVVVLLVTLLAVRAATQPEFCPRELEGKACNSYCKKKHGARS